MATFTATHGVEFGEQEAPKKAGGEPGPYIAWAKFVHDPERDTVEGVKTYVFSTDDEAVAARVRAVNDYGIAEVEAPVDEAPVDEAPPAPDAPAA